MFRQVGIGAASALLLLVVVGAGGCMSAKGETLQEKRDYALDMQSSVLQELYEQKPEARAKVESAAGYGVFTNLGSKIFLLATGSGFGVVHDNKTGKDTYMKMIEVGGGVGLGIKKFKAVFVFNDADAMRDFLESGWEFGGDADAAAKAGDTGAAGTAQGTTGELDGLEIYQFTDSGIALSATAAGTKYAHGLSHLNDTHR
ncbi:MAG: lipid-binding SYLF domain-containing protein [Planctomycetota bacterium]